MDIEFKTKALKIALCDGREMVKVYGAERAKKLRVRMAMFFGAATLAEIPSYPPFRLHALTGKRNGQYAIDVNANYRLILEPNHAQIPTKPDGGCDLSQVTAIRILGVEDYH